MKKFFTFLALSLMMTAVTVPANASADHGRDRTEYRGNNHRGNGDRNRHDKNKHDKGKYDKDRHDKDKHNKDKHDKGKYHKDRYGNKRVDYRPVTVKHHAPVPPGRFKYRNKWHNYPDNLARMARHAAGNGKIVNVWMVNPETYLVQYRHGNRYYTRYFYPYANSYSSPAAITVNWNPMASWLAVPPIQFNINF